MAAGVACRPWAGRGPEVVGVDVDGGAHGGADASAGEHEGEGEGVVAAVVMVLGRNAHVARLADSGGAAEEDEAGTRVSVARVAPESMGIGRGCTAVSRRVTGARRSPEADMQEDNRGGEAAGGGAAGRTAGASAAALRLPGKTRSGSIRGTFPSEGRCV